MPLIRAINKLPDGLEIAPTDMEPLQITSALIPAGYDTPEAVEGFLTQLVAAWLATNLLDWGGSFGIHVNSLAPLDLIMMISDDPNGVSDNWWAAPAA